MLKPKMLQWILGVVILLAAFVLFGWIVIKDIGGEVVFGAIIGHVAAWAELVVIHYFRKKAPKEGE